MDQNVSIEEVLNNSFSTIYDVLKLVDSKVNDDVINSINNNAESDEIVRLQLFKEAYIKAIQETKHLQNSVVSLINYNEKSIEEIKSEMASMENTQETELVNEAVQPVEEDVDEDTNEVENENVEMSMEDSIAQGLSVPAINETPAENEEAMVEENADNVDQDMVDETDLNAEQPIEEAAEVEFSDDAPIEDNSEEINEEDTIAENNSENEVVSEENATEDEVVNEENNEQEVDIPSVNDAPVEDNAIAEDNSENEVVSEENATEDDVVNEENNEQEVDIPSVSEASVEDNSIAEDNSENEPTAEENTTEEAVANEENESAPVIPLVEGTSDEEEAQAEISFDGVNQEKADNVQQEGIVLPIVEAPEADDKNNSTEKLKIYKTSSDSAKVILTTDAQYQKLSASKDTKKALLSAKGMFLNDDNVEEEAIKNGLVEDTPENMQKQVEELIAQAQSLYKDGKAQEAQEIMNQVAVLNEKIKSVSNSSGEDEKQFQLTA